MPKHNAEGTYDPESRDYPTCNTCPACRSEGRSTDTTGCTLP